MDMGEMVIVRNNIVWRQNEMKRIFSIVCCAAISLALLLSLTACGTSIQEDWATVILGKYLPTPQEGKLRSGSNLDDIFMGGIENVSNTYFVEYKQACIGMGYDVDSKESGSSYDAFNAEGYKLSLSYYNEGIHISLNAPLQLAEIEWPQAGLGAKLPAPASSMGKVTSDSSNSFVITIGNMGMGSYAEYVKACEEKGFVEDYTKADERYEAKDAEGYRLVVRYIGCDRIEIMIQTPKKEEPATQPETTIPTETINESDDSSELIDEEFKAAMDSYEQFMDEYVAFMKKYQENPMDISLLADYAEYMNRYAEYVKDFEAWEGKELNVAETAYYIDVQTRVNKKLLEAIE